MPSHPGIDDQSRKHQWASQVDLEGFIPGAELDVERQAEVGIGRGIVNQDVDPTKALDHLADEPLGILGTAHVSGDRRDGSGMTRIDSIRRRL